MNKWFKKKELTTKQIISRYTFIKNTMKFFAIIGLIGMLWSSGPSQYLQAIENRNAVQEQMDLNKLANEEKRIEEIPIRDVVTTDDPNYNPRDIPIISEVESLRTENTKTFLKADGSYEVAVYNEKIHYLENDKYVSIDNRLQLVRNKLQTIKNTFELNIPQNTIEDDWFTIENDGYELSWCFVDINHTEVKYETVEKSTSDIKEVAQIKQSISYENVYDNVDVEYIITGSRIKENVILNEYIKDFSFSIEYLTGELELLQEGTSLVFVDKDKKIIY